MQRGRYLLTKREGGHCWCYYVRCSCGWLSNHRSERQTLEEWATHLIDMARWRPRRNKRRLRWP